jgi:hypothetical protein
MSAKKSTKTTIPEKKVGRLQSRLERLLIIKDAAARHHMKSLWLNEKLLLVSGR